MCRNVSIRVRLTPAKCYESYAQLPAQLFLGTDRARNKMSKKIVLFDVDGTLTVPRKKAEPNMLEFLSQLRKKHTVGIVGGSDLVKIKEQLGDDVLDRADFTFSENGLMAHKGTELLAVQSLRTHLGEEKLKKLLNFILKYLSGVDVPVKRGTFVEFRAGMMNVSPIGRNCSQEERDAFEQFDKEANVRKKMVNTLREEFADLDLTYSIGGQISFDVFPKGWDKTYCLQFVKGYDEIHFFGDKTYQGGNDYEIFESSQTIGHTTTGPEDTIKQCTDLFLA